MTGPRELDLRRQAALDALFDGLPADHDALKGELEAVYYHVRERMAAALEPSLNESLQSSRPASYSGYREIAANFDSTVTDLGLCAAMHERPVLLVAKRDGRGGCFALLGVDHDASRRSRRQFKELESGTTPPALHLKPAPRNTDFYLKPIRDHAYGSPRSR